MNAATSEFIDRNTKIYQIIKLLGYLKLPYIKRERTQDGFYEYTIKMAHKISVGKCREDFRKLLAEVPNRVIRIRSDIINGVDVMLITCNASEKTFEQLAKERAEAAKLREQEMEKRKSLKHYLVKVQLKCGHQHHVLVMGCNMSSAAAIVENVAEVNTIIQMDLIPEIGFVIYSSIGVDVVEAS